MQKFKHNALKSPGYDPSKLSDDRLQNLMALSKKASQTFPPAFENSPYQGPVETPQGNLALKRGRWANSKREPAIARLNPGFPTLKELDEELGGPDGLFTLFACHYCRMFADPRMSVLFDTRDKDSAASAMDHGKRIGSMLLDSVFGTNYFASLGRGYSSIGALLSSHAKAKKCPMRPLSQQKSLPKGSYKANRRFTTNQRDTWVGHVMCGAEECGTSEEFQMKLGLWLAMTCNNYGPFVDEETGKLDWMEEMPY